MCENRQGNRGNLCREPDPAFVTPKLQQSRVNLYGNMSLFKQCGHHPGISSVTLVLQGKGVRQLLGFG